MQTRKFPWKRFEISFLDKKVNKPRKKIRRLQKKQNTASE